MSLERTSRCTAGIADEHRCLHFHEVSAVEEVTDLLNDLGSLNECILDLRIYDEVEVTLTVTHICVRQTVVLFRKDLQGLGEELELFCVNGDLTGSGSENITLDADDIADVHLLEILIVIYAEGISCNVELDVALKITDGSEGSFTHDTLEHHTTGNGNLDLLTFVKFLEFLGSLFLGESLRKLGFKLCVEFLELGFCLQGVIGHVVFRDLERVFAVGLQLGELLSSDLQQLVKVLYRSLVVVVLVSHFASSFHFLLTCEKSHESVRFLPWLLSFMRFRPVGQDRYPPLLV